MKKGTKIWVGLAVALVVVGIGAAVAIKLNAPTLRKIYHCTLDQGIKPWTAATGTVFTESNATNPKLQDAKPVATKVVLAVPYVAEAPDGVWTGPWKNACEEASITMVEKYYAGEKIVSVSEAKVEMQMLFKIQDKVWGSDANSDASRTAQLINDYTTYTAKIVDNPTVEQIKNELKNGHPVISLHYGKDLNNANIPFLRSGSYYHMMVIMGYDDASKEFITNDDGDAKTGQGHRYDYTLFMHSLHDYIYATKKTDGPPRVIFTLPKPATGT